MNLWRKGLVEYGLNSSGPGRGLVTALVKTVRTFVFHKKRAIS
jgi:hypothetical protein